MKEKDFAKRKRQIFCAALSSCLMLTAAPIPVFASGGGQNELPVMQDSAVPEEAEWQNEAENFVFSDGNKAEDTVDAYVFSSSLEENTDNEASGFDNGNDGEGSNQYAVQIGKNYYETLKEAWEAAKKLKEYQGEAISEKNPVVITLLEDCTINEQLALADNTSSMPPQVYKQYIKLTSASGSEVKTIKRGFSSTLGSSISYMISINSKDSRLVLENIILDGDKANGNKGGGISVNKGSVVLGDGAIIQNHDRASSGAGMNIWSGAKVMMNGGTIENNVCSGNYTYGGGVFVDSGSEFIMTGGKIQNNSAYDGGGIYYSGSGEIQLTGGELSGNSAKYNSQQQILVANRGTLKLGGSISVTGAIELSYTSSGNSKIMLVSRLTNTINLSFSANSIEPDTTIITKGENYNGSLDISKFALADMSDRELKLSEDGESIIASTANVTYIISVQSPNDMGLIAYTYDRTLEAGKKYSETLKFSDEYAEKYVFSSDRKNWTVDSKSTGSWNIKSNDDYDTVTLTLSKYKMNVLIVAYAVEKPVGPNESVVTINYVDETLTYTSSYEVYTDKQKSTKIESGSKISIPAADEEAVTVYVRTKRTTNAVQSQWTAVTIWPRADYTKVDEAIAKIPSELSKYTADSVKKLKDAEAAVDRSKNKKEQTEVDAMAQAIENAIKELKEEYIYIPPTPKPLPGNVPDGSRWDGDNIVTPDGTVIKPDETIVLPDGTELKPDENGKAPSINKEGTVTDTNGTTIDKDGTIILPGENPDSSEDDTRIEQGEGVKKPIYNPEAGNVTTEEGNLVTQPGGNQVHPSAGSIVEKDGTIKEPDGTVIAPDGTTTKPDGTVIDPDGTIHNTDGSIQSSDGTYLRPAVPWLESAAVYSTGNQIKAILSGPAAGAQGYDYVISENINCIKDKDYLSVSKNILLTETEFRYIPAGTYYVYCHAWIRGADGKKVFGNWSNYKTVTVTAITPEIPVIKSVKVKGNTVTVTYTKCKDAEGYDIVLGNAAKKVYNEKRPVDYGTNVKKVKGKNTVTAVFKNVKPGTYYVGLHAWNRTSEDGKKVFSPWSDVKKIKVK